MTQIVQWLGVDAHSFLFFVPVDVLYVFHYLRDRFRAHLLFWTRPFPHHRCLLYFPILHKLEYFRFLCIVLVCQVARQADLFSEPPHRVVVLFFFKLIQLTFIINHLFCITFRLFSRFCVILVSLSSFSLWMSIVSFNCLIPCQSWYNFFFLLNLIFPMQPHSSWLVSLYPISIDSIQQQVAYCLI